MVLNETSFQKRLRKRKENRSRCSKNGSTAYQFLEHWLFFAAFLSLQSNLLLLSHGIFDAEQKSEKERLYSLCYLHTGAPRVWYSVAGCHRYKFMESFVPKVSGEESKKSYDSVST